MRLTSMMALRSLCFFMCLALAVLVISSLLLPFWFNTIKHAKHELGSSSRILRSEILFEIENIPKLLLPINSSVTNLAKVLNSSLSDDNGDFSYSNIQNDVAPSLFQTLLLVPYLSHVSYVSLDGLFVSFFMEGEKILTAYSNTTFTSNASNLRTQEMGMEMNYMWYVQSVDRATGELYGEAVKSEPLINLDKARWIQETINCTNGFASLGTGWNKGRDLLFLNSVGVGVGGRGRGVISLGFLVKEVTSFFSNVDFHGGSLYLATMDGTVLMEGLSNTRMVVKGNSVISLHGVRSNGEEANPSFGNISCKPYDAHFGESSTLVIQGIAYLVYCSPIEILGVKSVYALAFPCKGLESEALVKETRVSLILHIVMLITLVITIFTFLLLMVRGARREMRQCSSLIKQMEATQQAERKSMNKSLAFAKASHDLRASLAGISGLIDISYDEVASGSQLESNLRQMDDCSKDLLGLLNSILDMSKVEAGKMVLEEEEFDLSQLLEDSVDLFHPVGMKKDVDVILDLHDGSIMKFSHVKGDRPKLRQILCNLLSNAVKFTSKGHVLVRAWIEKPSLETYSIIGSSNEDGFAKYLSCLFCKNSEESTSDHMFGVQPNNPNSMKFVFEVEDTGKGIPKEERESVFENYVQVKDSALGQGGTGLGLGIVQSLVRLMGGDIGIVDKENRERGTCFRFNVLLTICDQAVSDTNSRGDGGSEEKLQHSGPSPRLGFCSSSPMTGVLPRSPRTPEGSHVVLVLQNDVRRRVSQKFIASQGIKVSVVENWENLGSRLRRLKQKLSVSSSRSDIISPRTRSLSRSRNSSSSVGGKDVPLSSMDGTDQVVIKKAGSCNAFASPFVLIVIDANAGGFQEMCRAISEFRKGMPFGFCRVVWLERPGKRVIHFRDLEEGLVDPNDIVISKPFHGSRLLEVMKLLPEFRAGDKYWRSRSASSGNSSLPRGKSGEYYNSPPAPAPAPSPALTHLRSQSRDSPSPSPAPTQRLELKNSEIREIGSSSNGNGKALSGKRLLIAEDSSVLLKLGMVIVKKLGASVEGCENGMEALELVCNGFKDHQKLLPYDYILMDCEMPIMNGYEATRRIREVERQYGVYIPIIALTAHTAGEETARIFESGMDVYLCKPLKTDHLLKAITYIHTK